MTRIKVKYNSRLVYRTQLHFLDEEDAMALPLGTLQEKRFLWSILSPDIQRGKLDGRPETAIGCILIDVTSRHITWRHPMQLKASSSESIATQHQRELTLNVLDKQVRVEGPENADLEQSQSVFASLQKI